MFFAASLVWYIKFSKRRKIAQPVPQCHTRVQRAMGKPPAKESDKAEKEATSTQARSGLTIPIRRTEARLRFKARPSIIRVSGNTAIHVAATTQVVLNEILKAAGEDALASKQKRISVCHLIRAVQSCPDLSRVFAGFSFSASLDVPKATRLIVTKEKLKQLDKIREENREKREALKAAAANGN